MKNSHVVVVGKFFSVLIDGVKITRKKLNSKLWMRRSLGQGLCFERKQYSISSLGDIQKGSFLVLDSMFPTVALCRDKTHSDNSQTS